MKTIIFFLALLSSLWILILILAKTLSFLAKVMKNKPASASYVIELILAIIPIALWTYFYYL